MKKFPKQNIYALLAAMIWGMAFVAQSVSTEYVGALTFTTSRSALAALCLWVAIGIITLIKKKKGTAKPLAKSKKDLWLGGFLCGLALTLAVNSQQLGLFTTTPGKAGFITALYIVLVPILGLFIRRRVGRRIWLAVLLAVVGLYFLCITETFTVKTGDLLMIACAFTFSLQVYAIDYYVVRVNPVALSAMQFTFTALISGIGMFLFEAPKWTSIMDCLWPILYVGIMSSGVAYTLQILAQKNSNPTVICLIMSLESVFSLVASAIILQERLSSREAIGCVVMLVAVVLAELPDRKQEGDFE